MTTVPILEARQRAAQWRTLLDTLALGAPAALVAGALAGRLMGVWILAAIALLALAGVAWVGVRRARRLDQNWLIDAFDARFPGFEDSTGLLFQSPGELGGFAALQQTRLRARVGDAGRIDLRPEWSKRWIATAWGVAAVLIIATAFWPRTNDATRDAADNAAPVRAGAPTITGVRLRITPPAYTGLPAREQDELDARVPQGSRVEWRVRFAPAPATASIVFPETTPATLTATGGEWVGAQVIDQPVLYRIDAYGLARQRLHRLDAVADAPPVVRVVEPDTQLLLVTPGQTSWTPVFEASDDYGVAATATLHVTVTHGTGENVTFVERTMSLTGSGEARRRRFSATLDLAREGMAEGSDMIVQLTVSDNRSPEHQQVAGPSVILRWPEQLALADGLDGMVQRQLPAYFRSQRQIIIDAEALIAERPRLDPAQFVARSNSLGADQALLRMRYGQFLGGETESGGSTGGIALPTNDEPAPRIALPTNDEPAPAALPPTDDHDDDHGDAPAVFGSDVDALHDFGHAHDEGEAATLFDPGTRAKLTQALDAMFSSERALRQGDPVAALPFANRALDLLKEVQQATRIFLQRTGSNLPPIDFSRRLSGDRDDIVAGALTPVTRDPVDTTAADAWQALGDRPAGAASVDLGALDRWVRQNGARIPDPLALAAAIDTVRNEPGCAACRQRLRALLWTALTRPPVGVQRRAEAGPRGQRYLDALQ